MLDKLRRDKRNPGETHPLFDEAWRVPDAFNFAHDVIDGAASEHLRRGLTSVDRDGTIDRETFTELARASVRWANLLAAAVPERDARVILAIDSGAPRLAAFIGAIRCGLIPVLVSHASSPSDLAARAIDVDAALIVSDAPGAERVATPGAFLSLEDANWELMRAPVSVPVPVADVTDPALIVFTRGRGQRPKPVVHSHAAMALAQAAMKFWLGIRPGDVVYCGSSAAPAAALWNGVVGPWEAGAEILQLSHEIEIEDRIEFLERFAPTIVIQTPAEHLAMLDELTRSGRSLPRLRLAGSTGDRLDGVLADRFSCETGIPLLDAYGTAETGTIITQTVDGAEPVGAIGRAVPGLALRPATPDGGPVAQRIPGQLVLDGHPPSLFLGYWPDHWNLKDDLTDVDLRHEAWWIPTDDRFSTDASGAFWLEVPPKRRVRSPRAKKTAAARTKPR